METVTISKELLRALRGGRSQRAFSRWLGYRTNVAYTWESGRRWPTAAETLRVAQRAGVDVRAAMTAFHGAPPAWMAEHDPTTAAGVAALLRDLQGETPAAELARRTGLDRHAVNRWLLGRTEPKLPDFLRLLGAASLRLLDFLAVLADPDTLPSARDAWRRLLARRRTARELPWSQPVLRTIETADYAARLHTPGWIAQRLGIPADEEARCLDALAQSGQIAWDGSRWRIEEVTSLDLRADPAAARANRLHWARSAVDAVEAGRPGMFSHVVFACSRADLERLQEMQLAYFQAVRGVIAASEPSEVVGVMNLHLFELGSEAVDQAVAARSRSSLTLRRKRNTSSR
jgi:transcriptional regulator with XRE-family HTH domain